jgi:hypothetical protein
VCNHSFNPIALVVNVVKELGFFGWILQAFKDIDLFGSSNRVCDLSTRKRFSTRKR